MFVMLDLVVLGILLAAQWRLVRHLTAHGRRRWPHAAAFVFVLLAGVALSMSPFVNRFHLPPRFSLIVGGVTLLYLFTSSAAIMIHGLYGWLCRRLSPPPADPARRRLLSVAGGALAAIPFAVAAYGLAQRAAFRVREVDVPIPHLPPDLDGLRIVHLSDIHLSAFLSEAELARVIDAANELRPHLAVMTGDLISIFGDPLDACLRQLARLRAEAGVVGCLGNHERYARVENETAAGAARLGMRFLRRRAERLRFGGATLNVAGVDYEPVSRRPVYRAGAERLAAPGAVNVLLSHNPDVFPVAARKGFDLTLAGHTHGGQVSVEILDRSFNTALFLTPYVYGLYVREGRAAYVTRGIGTIGIPARIGAPAEIALVRLRKA
jgi:predicted MPP superfamily phosphohydrolase